MTIYELDADGNTQALRLSLGDHVAFVEDDLGGGTVKLQYSPDDGTTWYDVTDASWTAAGQKALVLGNCEVRFNLSGATSPTAKVGIL
ncbi:MAG: hypothetical protein ACOC00_00160 [Halothiobacillaceae bacterium]